MGLVIGLAVGFVFGYSIYFPQIEEQETINSELMNEIEALKALDENVSIISRPEALDTGKDVKVIEITASQFSFTPSEIKVNEGDIVLLKILSRLDKEQHFQSHGILIQGYEIDERLYKDRTTAIIFLADKAGTFTFRCNVDCGSKHFEMQGELIVEG